MEIASTHKHLLTDTKPHVVALPRPHSPTFRWPSLWVLTLVLYNTTSGCMILGDVPTYWWQAVVGLHHAIFAASLCATLFYCFDMHARRSLAWAVCTFTTSTISICYMLAAEQQGMTDNLYLKHAFVGLQLGFIWPAAVLQAQEQEEAAWRQEEQLYP